MITEQQVKDNVKQAILNTQAEGIVDYGLTSTDIDNILAGIDVAAIIAQEEGRIRIDSGRILYDNRKKADHNGETMDELVLNAASARVQEQLNLTPLP